MLLYVLFIWIYPVMRLRFLNTEFVRFVFIGGVNTISTQLLYIALLLMMPYPVAYTISYVAGIVLSYYLNSVIVFRQKLQWSKAIQFPAVYGMQYVLGIALLYVLVEWLHISEIIAPLVTVILTIPVMFIMSRLIIMRPLRDGSQTTPADDILSNTGK